MFDLWDTKYLYHSFYLGYNVHLVCLDVYDKNHDNCLHRLQHAKLHDLLHHHNPNRSFLLTICKFQYDHIGHATKKNKKHEYTTNKIYFNGHWNKNEIKFERKKNQSIVDLFIRYSHLTYYEIKSHDINVRSVECKLPILLIFYHFHIRVL